MRLRARLAAGILHLFGWRVSSLHPPPPKAVVIVYPHTSNWDFLVGILARDVLQLKMHWIGKHTLFRRPFGTLMRALGGVAVDRKHPQGTVEQLRGEFDRHATFYLVFTPEGTRRHTDYWKSGFYHLARELHVPVGLAYFDYMQREVVIVEWMRLTGKVEQDLEHIRDVYRDHPGKFPECAGTIRFKDS